MKVILGVSNSGKTAFVKKHLIKSTGITQSTLDPKRYYYKGEDIIDTPCFLKYKNFQHLIDVVRHISYTPLTHIVFFYQSNNQNKYLSEIIKASKILNFKIWINNISQVSLNFGGILDDIIIVDNNIALKKLFESTLSESDFSFLHRSVKSECLRVIFLGATNAGKSSLINSIVGENILTTSPLRHTTKEYSNCTTIINNQKFELFDSFGLEKSMRGRLNALKGLITTMDYAFIVTDVVNYTGKLVYFISSFLKSNEKSFSIILNKSDLITDRSLVKDIMGDLLFRVRNVKPILTNIRQSRLINYLKKIKTDNFKVNITQITKAVREKDENVLYIVQNLSSRFYHFIVYTRKRNLLKISLIRNIIMKHVNISNYHVKIEIFDYESKKE